MNPLLEIFYSPWITKFIKKRTLHYFLDRSLLPHLLFRWSLPVIVQIGDKTSWVEILGRRFGSLFWQTSCSSFVSYLGFFASSSLLNSASSVGSLSFSVVPLVEGLCRLVFTRWLRDLLVSFYSSFVILIYISLPSMSQLSRWLVSVLAVASKLEFFKLLWS